jgi:hypothetical protein
MSDLYEERGSVSGLQRMTTAATKYRCKVIEGINMMNLTDDAEFASEIGSWGNPIPEYASFILSHSWLGREVGNFNAVNLSSVSLLTTPEGYGEGNSLVLRRNAMLVGGAVSSGFDTESAEFDSPTPFDGTVGSAVVADIPFNDTTAFDYPIGFDGSISITNCVLITCGLGQGTRHGRRHEEITTEFHPRLHGIKCHSDQVYSFSGYSVLESSELGPTGACAVGIMWFNDDRTAISTSSGTTSPRSSPLRWKRGHSMDSEVAGPFKRYSVDGLAPVSLRGQPFVFAVPYFIFFDTFARYVSACMFHSQLNSAAEDFAIPSIQYLRLGVPAEPLGSPYVMGEDR